MMTVRYLLTVVAIAAVSIAVLNIPYRPNTAVVLEASNSARVSANNDFDLFQILRWWPVRLVAFIGAVTLIVDTVGRMIGLRGVWLWVYAIAVPTILMVGWHASVIYRGQFDPPWFTVGDALEISLVINVVCYTLLSTFHLVWQSCFERTADSDQ